MKGLGLTHEQFNALRILKGKHLERMRVKDIGFRMIEKNSNVPGIIDRLLEKKYVDRFITDKVKRETFISLTKDGINILEDANQKIDAMLSESVVIEKNKARLLNYMLENLRENE